METLVSKKYTHERKVAKIIVTKLKRAAATLESDDPSHKNGLKYMISKKVYDNTIELEFNKRCIAHGSRMIVREFINRSLINAN
tara:strand:- start:128 stop:379 length:252 start_codon:yes stop_codon:yes gene_type:complete